LSQLPVAYVDIRFCAHATEDVDKVMEAVQNTLPSDHIEDVSFKRSNVEGHYGNPITFFDARIKGKETVRALVENLSANLSSLDKDELGRTINRCVEKGSLYIRLDKQAALKGKIKFATSDPIRIRIRFRKNKIEAVIQICREIGMIT
jgi:RNA binding exosome subunit